jgi:thioredoxin 1
MQEIKTLDGFKPTGQSCVLFSASFHEACRPNGQMDTLFQHLIKKFPTIQYFKIDAEELSDLAEEFSVEVVPTVVFLKNRSTVDKVEGALPAKVSLGNNFSAPFSANFGD